MTRRVLKKKDDMARCDFIVDLIGSTKRGVLSSYLNAHPSDRRKVRKSLKRSARWRIFALVARDLRTDYRHPGYSEDETDYYSKFIRTVKDSLRR